MKEKWFVSASNIALAITLLIAIACTPEAATPTSPISNGSTTADPGQEPLLPLGEVDEAKERLAAKLIDMEGIVGVGVSECAGTECIKVFVIEKTQELVEAIPHEFEGFLVQIEETGVITAPPSDGIP